MSTNEERRAEARQRLRDELDAQKKREKRATMAVVAVASVIVLALVATGVTMKVRENMHESKLQAQQEAYDGYLADWAECDYAPSDDSQMQPISDDQMAQADDATKKQMEDYNSKIGIAKDKKKDATPPEGDQYKHGTTSVDLDTNNGLVDLTLDRGKAPCNAASFVNLVQQKYFDGTMCHRLTKTDPSQAAASGGGLSVLQCGDPTGTGLGGPGYTVIDEPPTDLQPGPDGQSAVYPRGTIAMAKSQSPNSAGSQFFLVYEDSMLPPDYSVMGTIGEKGLATLDKIAKAGTKSDDPQSLDAEVPAKEVDITTAKVTAEDPIPERPEKPEVPENAAPSAPASSAAPAAP